MNLKGKRLALAGFGAEGRSAAYFLTKNGAAVEIFDSKPEGDFPARTIAELRQIGVLFHFGVMGPFAGFDAIVRSPGISPRVPELSAAAGQGIPFTSATKIFFDLCPCSIVGVTGTKGKGTTSSLIHQMLIAAGKDAYLCGNIGAPALDFLDKLKPDSIVVYELSSFQLIELERSPQLAVVLMVTSEHLNFHATREEYVASKENIVRFQHSGDQAIINVDYPASRGMAALTPAEIFSVSRKEKVSPGAYVDSGSVMLAQAGAARKIVSVDEVSLAGPHNLENVCAAAMAAALFNVPDTVIASTIRSFRPLPHRLEFIREVSGVKYYDDSISTTPESAVAALRSFSAPKIMILGGSGKGADWEEFAAVLAAEKSLKAIIGVGEEWPKIKEAILKNGQMDPKVQIVEGLSDMPEIVRAAAKAAGPGDVVILSPACASFDTFRDYKDRGERFTAAVRGL